MRYTVDIDIGGTLTDGLFSDGRQVIATKVDTTPHDFTVCFFECIREGANRLGYESLTDFFADVKVIRWSSTIATNVLAEGKGPKLGLLISEGHGTDLYGNGVSPAINRVLSPENITQISEPISEEEVLRKVRALLEQGVRRICVSLKGAFEDPSIEQRIKKLVDEQFPDHYLGAVPVLLGSDILHHPDSQTRTHLSLINSYVHTPLAVALFKAEDELLLQHKYRKPVYIGHVNGGVARVAKTKGVDTTESGPVFGLHAASYFAKRYGLDKVLSVDVGGTTAKIGLILNGEVITVPNGDLFGIPLKTPWILLRSIALGGGSIARVKNGRVTLGPESMGAYPGPACYNLGGESATLTDAFLVSGAMNPDRFLGGRRRLQLEQARRTIQEQVAGPLNISIEAAAQAIIERAMEMVTDCCNETLKEYGYTTEGFSLFSFGGNGSNFASGVADKLNLKNAYVFGLGPVLSAFGSSVSDICHIHEEWPYQPLNKASVQEVYKLVALGQERVLRDLEGEGLSAADVELSVEFIIAKNNDESEVIQLPIEKALNGGFQEIAESRSGSTLERVSVKGLSPVSKFELPHVDISSQRAKTDQRRTMLWPKQADHAPIYDWEQLQRGSSFTGPACLESETVSCMVIPGWDVQIDGYGNAVFTKGGA
ncbi:MULTISPECIES: hydantoinase/oxoprolinase family protein [unclassified Paenibacillus]|uniref:hydantoinase/oxoprolinase family protein n=1 Tax=unclassified Paenibacillus TaxID=185978 RepID=UPI0021184F8F|nr:MULTISPECIES: hydantoinase/oxoprolinase family protein [unclassified Paenibacillus]